jgi:hypothetical protein
MMHRLVGYALCAALAASPRIADANSCNLYQPQTFGEIRVGCSITVFALPEVEPSLPTITREGQIVAATIDHDQLELKVTMGHYPSPESCSLLTSYENRTFDRYVIAWNDLQPGDEILIDGYPLTVPDTGDCGVVAPSFYCQDPIQGCDDQVPDQEQTDDDQLGCSAGSGSLGWLAIFAVVALVGHGRRSRAVRTIERT